MSFIKKNLYISSITHLVMRYYVASKGDGRREKFTFRSAENNMIRVFVFGEFAGITTFILNNNVTELCSFGYSFRRLKLRTGCDFIGVNLYNIKDEYRSLLGLPEDQHANRMMMADVLGIEIKQHEYNAPKADGVQTTGLYQAIVTEIEQRKLKQHSMD